MFDLKQNGTQEDPESSSGGIIKDKFRLSIRKKKKCKVEDSRIVDDTSGPVETDKPQTDGSTENLLKDIESAVIDVKQVQPEGETQTPVETEKVKSAKPSKFKDLFRKKEQNVEKTDISKIQTEVEDDHQMSNSINIDKVNPENTSSESVVKKEKFSLFHKKEKIHKVASLSSIDTSTDVDQSAEKSTNSEKENMHKKFGLFHNKDKSEVEPIKPTISQSLDGLDEIGEGRDETKKKEKFHLFPKKKNKTGKETNSNIVAVNLEETKVEINQPEVCLDEQKQPSKIVIKKDKFRSLFQKKNSEKEQENLVKSESEEQTSESFIEFIEVKETNQIVAVESEEKQKKEKSKNIYKTNKKIAESTTLNNSDQQGEALLGNRKEVAKDTSNDISENQPDVEVDSNKSEKKKFNLFPKKKKPDTESQSLQEKEITEAPETTLKKSKSKSIFKSSDKSKNAEVQPAPTTEVLEDKLQTKKDPSIDDYEFETKKDHLDMNNPAVMPLMTAEKSKIHLMKVCKDKSNDQFNAQPEESFQKENPAVTLLQPNLINPEETVPVEQPDLNCSLQSSSITSSEENVFVSTNEATGMDKFRNMFKKKKVEENTETIPLIGPEKDSEVVSDTLVGEQVEVEQVISKEKTKSRNIFKRNKNPQITTEETLNASDNSENDDGWAITPVTIVDIDKQVKHHKTWSERMRLPTPRPSKKMADSVPKENTRNEDNEMDLPDGQDPMLDEQHTAVKLLNETLEPSSTSNISIEEQMQLLCDLFGHQSDVIWDSYTPRQKEALKNKLKLVLDPGPNSKKRNVDKHVNDMTETIWNQSKYTDGVLNMGILFVALLNEKELDVRNAKRYSLRPVFRSVKCYNKDNKSTKGCCMIFIDESGRVYRNWEHFMAENTYEPSIIVAPAKGIFNTDAEGKVCLEFFTAPSSSVGAKILSITDKTATVTGLGASACFIGGMLTVALLPIAAPAIGIAMAGAGLVGAASAGYSMVRSTQKMKDLSEHEKSLNIKDAEARGHWLGLIGGLTGFVSGVASHGIDIIARSGTHVPAFFRGSIDAINAASIAVNGVGVIDGFSTVFLKWNEEKISTLEIMQLSASLFMFTHSIYNFETANSIITKTHHDITVNEFRDKLSQNQRQHYHKMASESLKVHGKGHKDVIRSLRAIPNQTDFQKMHKADNAITEGMATAAALLVAKFCKKYFVVDENDLANTVLNAMTLLSDHAFDVFVDVVERFVECKGDLVQKSLRGIISLEEVMSDVLISVTSISESLGLDTSEFIETLTKTDNFLSALIERIYDMYKDYERVSPNQTCAECKGVFSTTTTKSVKE